MHKCININCIVYLGGIIMKKLLLILMALLLVSCSSGGGGLSDIQTKGVIIVGTCADYPPYEFHKEINGEDTIVGFDIALAEKIAEDLGVELEIVDMKFDGLLPALISHKIDFIAAGMNPTEDRKKSVDFSNIYYDTSQTMLVLSDKVDVLNTIQAFDGLIVGVQKSTLQETIANEQFPNAEKVLLSKIPDIIMALQAGKVDGIILAEVVANSYADANDAIDVNHLDLGSEGGVSIAMNKGDDDLLKAVNSTIEQVLSDGSLDQYILDAMTLAEED